MFHSVFESLLQQTLQLSPKLQKKSLDFEKKSLNIIALPQGYTQTLLFVQGEIYCPPPAQLLITPDATLALGPAAMVGFLFHQDTSGFQITGDIALVQFINQLFDFMKAHWDSFFKLQLEKIVGTENYNTWFDYPLKIALTKTKANVCTHLQRLKNRLTDYLQEEAEIIPFKDETEDFCEQVDELRYRVDKLQAYQEIQDTHNLKPEIQDTHQ